jgi:hypothetical protein
LEQAVLAQPAVVTQVRIRFLDPQQPLVAVVAALTTLH